MKFLKNYFIIFSRWIHKAALHIAVDKEHEEVVKLLVSFDKTDVNQKYISSILFK